jgi:tetratricopeptide (TPR) repeat protein/sugar lactone lactonase YvrE
MRILTAVFVFLSLSTLARAESPAPAAPLAQLSKVEFVQEIPMAGSKKLLGQSGDRFFLDKGDGSVKVISIGKKESSFVLPAKIHKNEVILKQPEAAVEADDTIYVVDSELNRVVMFTADGKYKGSFGNKGSNPGELRSPRGITFHDGILYVADSGNERIELFGDNGVFLNILEIDSAPGNKAAKEKKLPYQLNKPVSVSIDPGGRVIYVLDVDSSLFSDTYSIKLYGPDGTFLKQLQNGAKPVAISAVSDGLYVADADSFSIQRYDTNGKLVSSFGSKGNGRAQFKSMNGLTADNGQVYLGDGARGAILDFRPDTSALPAAQAPRQSARAFVRWIDAVPDNVNKLAWNDAKGILYGINRETGAIVRIRNGKNDGEVKIKSKDLFPEAVTADKNGELWVLDRKKMQVVKLDDSGNPVVTFGAAGSGNGQFDDPSDIAISSSGIIFVADSGNHRIQAFSDDGVFLSDITRTVSGKLDHPSAIALDAQDNLYVLDKYRSTVSVYSAKGEALAEFGKDKTNEANNLKDPRDLMATGNEVFVAEPDRIRVYSHDGKYLRSFGAHGKDDGEFADIAAIATQNATTFFVAERGNKRIQAFTTLYKPEPPGQVAAQGAAHAAELHWAPSPQPYVAQYQIYRSKTENGEFVRIGTSKANEFSDDGLPPDETYYYRVSAESGDGYEGIASPVVSAASQKYNPPLPGEFQVTPTAVQLKIDWKPLDSRYISAYLVYRKDGDTYTKIGETVAPEFVEGSLTPGTNYTFYVSARSVDGIESGKSAVAGTTSVDTSTPLDINVGALRDIFSNTYKLYEQDGVGTAKFTNNTTNVLKNIKVSFVLNNFMDYPTESRIDALAPGETREVPLKAVFNNNILTLTEDTPVQAKVEASYYENGQKKVFSNYKTINIYDKHRLMWNEEGRFAAFITPKDPVPLNYTRMVATGFPSIKDAPQLAAAVFDSLGVLGITYVQNPTNPYQETYNKVDYVDYIQYPRETLQRKAGECTDLTALYSSSLEGLGISTRVLLVPGHMFMMFSTGVDASPDGYTMDKMYAIYDGQLWIPVETTLLGKSFASAWEKGAEEYYKSKDNGLSIFDPHMAWAKYKPATLPDDTWKGREITSKDIEKAFPGDMLSILKISLQTKTRRYVQAIQKNPSDWNSHLQLGIIMAKAGDKTEAMKYFRRVVENEPENAAALNNIGNLSMLDGQYQNAQKSYLEASKADPLDAEILINLARTYKAENNLELAKKAFVKASKIDPSVSTQHKALALELLSTLSPEHKKSHSRKSGSKKSKAKK